MTDFGLPTAEGEKLSWSIKRRLEFIEFRLLWDGRVNRSGLRREFQISEQQASLDIGRYLDAAPLNMKYDGNQKAYLRSTDFKPLFIAELTDRYMLQLHAISSGKLAQHETWFDNLPVSKVAALPHKPKNWSIVMCVVDAIRSKLEISIEYHSLTGTSASTKNVAPHALGYGAGRWHMRAWTREHDDFRDYTIDRILNVSGNRPAEVDPKCDLAWHEDFEMILAPNPELPKEHQEAIEGERAMTNGELRCSLPISMCFYLEGELNLDLIDKVKWGDGTDGTVKPARMPLILKNRAEYDVAKMQAREGTRLALAEYWNVHAELTESAS